MGWFTILKLLLQLAAVISRRVEEEKVRKAFADALLVSLDTRVAAAVRARSAALNDGVRDDVPDKYRRD